MGASEGDWPTAAASILPLVVLKNLIDNTGTSLGILEIWYMLYTGLGKTAKKL